MNFKIAFITLISLIVLSAVSLIAYNYGYDDAPRYPERKFEPPVAYIYMRWEVSELDSTLKLFVSSDYADSDLLHELQHLDGIMPTKQSLKASRNVMERLDFVERNLRRSWGKEKYDYIPYDS